MMKRLTTLSYVGLFALFMLIGFDLSVSNTEAQALDHSREWNVSQRIPFYGNDVWTPYLVVDGLGTIHVFASDWVGDSKPLWAIIYRQWTLNEGWSEPIDILLPASGLARIQGAFLDQTGFIHLVYFGGDEISGQIYYSRAPAEDAARAPAWSEPLPVGGNAIIPADATINGDDQGNLFVLYNSDKSGNGLYETHSIDGGDTWSESQPIYLTYRSDLRPLTLKSYVDKDGAGHAVWSLPNNTGNSEAVYYARQEPGQAIWRVPVLLAEAIEGEVDTPTIIEYQDELFIIYHDGRPTMRHMIRSTDGGESWSDPVPLFHHIGSNGAASLVVDGNNILHMFFGNRVGEHPATHAMWHSTWSDIGWSDPGPIISGLKTDDFDPSFANAIISRGNTILLTWMTDPGAIRKGVGGTWYSYRVLDAQELPLTIPVAVSAPTPISEHVFEETTLLPAPTPIPGETQTDLRSESPNSWFQNPMTLVFVSIVPVGLLMLAIVAFRTGFIKRR